MGAGAAGLATAACLQRRGVRVRVVDRGTAVGDVWRARYDRLHLHTPRIQSGMPGLPLAAATGRWVARDDLADYLARYATHHGITPEFGVDVTHVDTQEDGWTVRTGVGDVSARQVVLACGFANLPHVPDWGTGTVPVLHSSQYRNSAEFTGRRVLVVGAGNSGAEIATDLAEGGAAEVLLSVRTPPNLVPRDLGPLPATLLGVAEEFLPTAALDPVNRLVRRVFLGNLENLGLPAPTTGLVEAVRTRGTTPVIDVGLVENLRSGRVRVVPAVVRLDGDSVELADGRTVAPDVVVAATGWNSPYPDLVGHLGVLDAHGEPRVHGAPDLPHAPGLRFVGVRTPLRGALLQANLDARAVARAVAADLTRTPRVP